jgi:peptidoglycan hydrolase CwlO-like protein
MHRSGTSFISRLMQHGGLYLGEERDLMPPGPDNPDGYFENRRFFSVNERLLHRFGGDWDLPPVLPAGWEDDDGLAPLRQEAHLLSLDFDGHRPWGWKDPRSSLTLPFWRSVIPDLRVIVCVRNPLEVAISLNRRNLISYELGLHLWNVYTERLLDGIGDLPYTVVHYEACMTQPGTELGRLGRFAGLAVPAETREQAASIVSARLRHSAFTLDHLRESRVSPRIVDLYRRLCDEAGWDAEPRPQRTTADAGAPDESASPGGLVPSARTPDGDEDGMTVHEDRSLRRSVIEVELLRRDMVVIQQSEAHHKALAQQLQQQVEERDAHIVDLQKEQEERLAWIKMLQETIAERDAQVIQLQTDHEARLRWITSLQQAVDERDARIVEIQGEHEAWREWITKLQQEIAQRDVRIAEIQDEHEAWREWITKLQQEIDQRGARIVEIQGEHEEWREWITRLNADIEGRDALIQLLRQEMHRRDELLAALRESSGFSPEQLTRIGLEHSS